MKKICDFLKDLTIFPLLIYYALNGNLILAAEEAPQSQPLVTSRSGPELFVILISLALFWLFAGGALVVLLMKIRESDRIFRLRRKEQPASK